jgi:predicted nucleic acid-binding protein
VADEAPDRYLADANIVSYARVLRFGLPDLVGCPAQRVGVPSVALDECLATTPPTHPRRNEYLRVVQDVAVLYTADVRTVQLATEMLTRYARHGAALPDMLVAAVALQYGYTLISTNWRDFHVVRGLWLIDARYLETPTRGPAILERAAPPVRGPVLPPPRCCKGLVNAGVLP